MGDLSNNPFIDRSSTVASRFPDISSPSTPSATQYSPSWPQQQPQQQQQQQQQQPYQHSGFVGTNPTGYPQQYFQQPQWPQQQQQPQYQSQLQTPYSPTNYQSPSPLGQQFVGQVSPLTTSYPQQPQVQAQYTGYPTQQAANYGYQQPQQQTGYLYPPPQQQQQRQLLAQFDPYANLGQQQQQQPPHSPPGAGAASLANGVVGSPPPSVQHQQQHPRVFIHANKTKLEAWDPMTWDQVQRSFEALKAAWETRKRNAEGQVRALGATATTASGFFNDGAYGGYGGYQTPQAQEINRLNALIKEADSNIDIVAAATLQMSEVFAGYRHSGDITSKRRVRESCNAAVTGLPEYPPSTL